MAASFELPLLGNRGTVLPFPWRRRQPDASVRTKVLVGAMGPKSYGAVTDGVIQRDHPGQVHRSSGTSAKSTSAPAVSDHAGGQRIAVERQRGGSVIELRRSCMACWLTRRNPWPGRSRS